VNYTAFRRRYLAADADVQSAAQRGEHGHNRELVSLTEALRSGKMRPHDFSLQQLFDEFVGESVRKTFNPRFNGHGSAPLSPLLEDVSAVSTTHFSNITGQIVYSTVLEAWNNPMLIGGDLCTTIPTVFDGEKIAGIGGIGDQAESIGEGQNYPFAGLSEEWIETPSTIKRGMIVPVTKEAIFFDRTGLVLSRAGEVGMYIALNKEKRILDMALGLTTSYRRNGGAAQATYGDTHTQGDFDNLAASNALADYTDIENALLLFDAMTDPNTGEPIIVDANTIVVPTALSMTLDRILNATQVGNTASANTPVGANPLRGNQFQKKSNAYVKARTSSASTWFVGDFKGAFVYMENWPITVTQAPPNSHDEFHRDIVSQFKVSERGAAAVREPRRVVKNTA
jgi:hypothetical protein